MITQFYDFKNIWRSSLACFYLFVPLLTMNTGKQSWLLIFIVLVFVFLGCSEHDEEPGFVPGNVIVGLNKQVTLRQALEFGARHADSVARMVGFSYVSNLPNDSVDYLNQLFDTRGFNYAIAFLSTTDNKIITYDDKSMIWEWLKLTEDPSLKFQDSGSFISMMYYMPAGTEKQWIQRFTGHPYVRYLELDYYVVFH